MSKKTAKSGFLPDKKRVAKALLKMYERWEIRAQPWNLGFVVGAGAFATISI